jgi:GYF domain 2
MEYFIKRGEQSFGPYGLADLQKYVQSGNLVPEDLAQSEGMTDWVPLSQVLGNIPALAMSGAGSAPVVAAEPQLVPLPFNLHWLIVLVLGLFTRQLFNLLWALVQGNWARKLSGDNKPLVLVAMYPAGMVAGILTVALSRGAANSALSILGALFMLGGAIVYLFGMFSIKAAMEEYYTSVENIGLQMSGVMTFFFSTVYIQYHINSIARWKKTGVLK